MALASSCWPHALCNCHHLPWDMRGLVLSIRWWPAWQMLPKYSLLRTHGSADSQQQMLTVSDLESGQFWLQGNILFRKHLLSVTKSLALNWVP